MRLDVAERQLRPAKRRSTDLDVYPQFVFHTGNELSLSSASLAVSPFSAAALSVPLRVCDDEFVHIGVSVSVYLPSTNVQKRVRVCSCEKFAAFR